MTPILVMVCWKVGEDSEEFWFATMQEAYEFVATLKDFDGYSITDMRDSRD